MHIMTVCEVSGENLCFLCVSSETQILITIHNLKVKYLLFSESCQSTSLHSAYSMYLILSNILLKSFSKGKYVSIFPKMLDR